VGPVQVEPGEEVKFEAIATDDWGEDLTGETEWTWDFGDGEQSNENPVWHVLEGGGTFEVTVTACCRGQEASDRIICRQFPPGVVWSIRCSIQIIGQTDPNVDPGGYPGLRGGQARVRGEALQPQPPRKPAAGGRRTAI